MKRVSSSAAALLSYYPLFLLIELYAIDLYQRQAICFCRLEKSDALNPRFPEKEGAFFPVRPLFATFLFVGTAAAFR